MPDFILYLSLPLAFVNVAYYALDLRDSIRNEGKSDAKIHTKAKR